MGIFADQELAVFQEMPPLPQFVDLLQEDLRVDDDPVADHADLVPIEGSGRNQVKDDRLLAHHDGVPRVIPSLEADHHVGVPVRRSTTFPFPSSPTAFQ